MKGKHSCSCVPGETSQIQNTHNTQHNTRDLNASGSTLEWLDGPKRRVQGAWVFSNFCRTTFRCVRAMGRDIKPTNNTIKSLFWGRANISSYRDAAAPRSLTQQKNPEKLQFNPDCFQCVSSSLLVSITSFIKQRTHSHTNRYRRTHNAHTTHTHNAHTTHTHTAFDCCFNKSTELKSQFFIFKRFLLSSDFTPQAAGPGCDS